jgi:hypothetical protein
MDASPLCQSNPNGNIQLPLPDPKRCGFEKGVNLTKIIIQNSLEAESRTSWRIKETLRIGAGGRNRTDTGWKPRGILSPVRLPVSPLRRTHQYKKIYD